jgi:hypothetical protein
LRPIGAPFVLFAALILNDFHGVRTLGYVQQSRSNGRISTALPSLRGFAALRSLWFSSGRHPLGSFAGSEQFHFPSLRALSFIGT